MNFYLITILAKSPVEDALLKSSASNRAIWYNQQPS